VVSICVDKVLLPHDQISQDYLVNSYYW